MRQWRFRKRDIDAWLDTQRPRGDRAPSSSVADRPQARDGRSRVLVVDDESSIRELLQKTLGLAEYDVDTAPDGRAALERLRLGNYDLLIADLKMPGMDGLTLIREAKRLKADLPVIIITGFSTESSAIEAVNLGVAGYLTKPFRVPQVLAAAARALGVIAPASRRNQSLRREDALGARTWRSASDRVASATNGAAKTTPQISRDSMSPIRIIQKPNPSRSLSAQTASPHRRTSSRSQPRAQAAARSQGGDARSRSAAWRRDA